jgi:hypothetical protein
MNNKLIKLCRRRDLVAIFRGLANDEVFDKLMVLIGSNTDKLTGFLSDYSDFVTALYNKNTVNLSQYLLDLVLEDENIYIKEIATGGEPPKEMKECVKNELEFLQEISQLSPKDFSDSINYKGFLPRWTTSKVDFIKSYEERLSEVEQYGYGKWTRSDMFTYRGKNIIPVMTPDPQRLSELYGYKDQRRIIIDNTLALLKGKPALNVLLYGDAGTGKSSTVKAIVNEFAELGLRLIEITKEQLRHIPEIITEVSQNPLKFVIFIDDLSFTPDEDRSGTLKAALEGSAAARTQNVVIYATSNCRNLVKESVSGSEDDNAGSDDAQEMLSISASFDIRVNFSRPDKEEYINIACEIAKQSGVIMDRNDLALKAEEFALSSGSGRSPRTAKQFVHHLLNELIH